MGTQVCNACLIRYISDAEAVAEALARVWPLLAAAVERGAGNARAVEHLLRAPRYALRTAGRAAAPLLPTLAQARCNMYCLRAT